MKIKDLEYYQQLIKDQNFSKVAQYFGVSQPTITMAIQRLEQDFNTTFLSVTMFTGSCTSPPPVSSSPTTST